MSLCIYGHSETGFCGTWICQERKVPYGVSEEWTRHSGSPGHLTGRLWGRTFSFPLVTCSSVTNSPSTARFGIPAVLVTSMLTLNKSLTSLYPFLNLGWPWGHSSTFPSDFWINHLSSLDSNALWFSVPFEKQDNIYLSALLNILKTLCVEVLEQVGAQELPVRMWRQSQENWPVIGKAARTRCYSFHFPPPRWFWAFEIWLPRGMEEI